MNKINLIERVKKNPVIAIIIIIAVVLSFSIGWIIRFYDEKIELVKIKYENTITELNIKLNSIPRDKENNEYLNITKMFASKTSLSSINQNCTYFAEDRFYALKETEHFKYRKYTTEEYDKEFNKEESMPELKDVIIHLWAPKEIKYFSNLNEIKIASPTISVSKINNDKLSILVEVMIMNAEINKNIMSVLKKSRFSNEIENEKILNSKLKSGLNIYKSNILQITFQQTLGSMLYMQQNNENVSYELQNLTKIKNIYYMQGLITLKNVVIDGTEYPEYFIRNELYLTNNNNELFSITINVPSKEPIIQKEIYNEISNWLNNFVIIID